MFLRPHVLIRLLCRLEGENLLIDHRLDVIRLDGPVHLLKLDPRADEYTSDGADVHQGVQHRGLVLRLHAAQEADDADDAFVGDGVQTLLHGSRTADFDYVFDTVAARELLGCLAPVGVFFVVDDVVGAEGLESVAFGRGGCGCDYSGAGGLGELPKINLQSANLLLPL